MAKRLLLKLWKRFADWRRQEAEARFLATLSDHELKEIGLDQGTIKRIRIVWGCQADDPTRGFFHWG